MRMGVTMRHKPGIIPAASDVPLRDAPLGRVLVLREAGLPPSTRRRLSTLGLRPGSRLRLLAKTFGGGRVAKVGEARLALGAPLCRELRVDVTAG